MNALFCLALAGALAAQDAAPKAPDAPASLGKHPAKPSVQHAGQTAASPQSRRKLELEKRKAEADKRLGEAQVQKRLAQREEARQAGLKRAEMVELKKADKAKVAAEAAQRQAELHRKKAEEIRKRAEASWKTYQTALKPKAVAPKKADEAVKEAPKEAPKEMPKPEEVAK